MPPPKSPQAGGGAKLQIPTGGRSPQPGDVCASQSAPRAVRAVIGTRSNQSAGGGGLPPTNEEAGGGRGGAGRKRETGPGSG